MIPSIYPQVTRRYAEFSAAIVSINQSHPDERVTKCLSTLQMEVENFILRMAAEFPHRKEQLIFLINNYDMLLAVLSVSCVSRCGWVGGGGVVCVGGGV